MDIEQRRKRIELGVKLAALAAVGFFVAPMIFVAVKGLVGLALAAAVGVAAINLAPWYAAKMANWRLKAIKAEAAANPVETLQNAYAARLNDLAAKADAIKKFYAEVKSFEGRLVEFKQKFPEEAPRFDEQHQAMRKLLELRRAKYGQAQAEVVKFNNEVQRAKAIWEMAQAAAVMTKAAGVDADKFLERIQTETALDTVEKSMNAAFAELEMSLMEQGEPTRVPLKASAEIDVDDVPELDPDKLGGVPIKRKLME